MSDDPQSPRSFALSYVSNSRFHSSFTFDSATTSGPLKVTYGEYGRAPNEHDTIPTLLFMPGMYSSRYIGICLHRIAEKYGVRVVVVDRPGMGKSTDVALAQRVSAWIEIVPRLLAHLNIQHVSLASHSAGTIYLLNTLYHCRDILRPDKAMVTLLAPWVDPAKSGNTTMKLAQYIPTPAFKLWHHIPRLFLVQNGSPIAKSGAVVAGFSASFPSKSNDAQAKNRQYIEENYALTLEQQKEIDSAMMQAMFQEDTVGSNSEALQCLRKETNTWGKCEDYEVFVRELVEVEKGTDGSPLGVRVFFAESDSMIGKKGQDYFENCWAQTRGRDLGGVVEFESKTVAGTDHDSLVQSAEVWESVFREMGTVEDDI
ncbi:uncharacterized protein N7515_001440 [Penicillium bovifimosum]|uniref:AB hydrolase-1 domain-containing protein n=1 Tax=Penicillium bovifimosum TaxID=126998 RepID=A0A9W9L893_9EURO|nr:uncharacterized protein N7515_001440 [Penicillium bovifimosum]KAJ5142653.1 hypothetical protein N7515_001440 [Penicillium bovifimosum]